MDQNKTINYKVQNLTFKNKIDLYRSYMPFIKDGGLFMHFNNEITANTIEPQQIVLVMLSLPGIEDKIPLKGKVVWINRNSINKGFGISISGTGQTVNNLNIKETIEKILSDPTLKKENRYTF